MAYLMSKNVIRYATAHVGVFRPLSLSFKTTHAVSKRLYCATVKLLSKEENEGVNFANSDSNAIPSIIHDKSTDATTESSHQTRNPKQFNPPYKMKTKESFLKEFTETLEKGEVLPTKAAFVFIKSCGPRMVGETDESRNQLVDYVWSELKKNGVDLQTGLWNTLLSVYIENQKYFEPIEFLKSLWETSSAEPNKTTFALLIQAYAVKGDPVGAMKIVDFMMKNESKMTEHIYAWLIQAFAKNDDMNGVEELLRTMNETGVRPRHTTFGNLINVYAEKGDLESIDKTLTEMMEKKIYPTSDMYISMLDHLSRGGHFDLLPKVWEKVDDIEYLADDVRTLVQKCVTRGDYKSALALIECSTEMTSNKKESYYFYIERKMFGMIRYSEKDLSEYLKASKVMEQHVGVPPHSRLHYIFDFLISKGELENTVEIVRLLPTNMITTKRFHPILRALARNKDVYGMVNVLDTMCGMDVPLDYYCAKIIVPSLGESSSDDYQTFLRLIKENDKIVLPFNVVSGLLEDEEFTINDLSSLVSNASNADLFSSLTAIKQKLISEFNAVDTSKIMITLYGRGIRNITVLVDEVIRSFVNNCNKGQALEALQFVKTLMENNIPLSSYTYTMILRVLHSNGLSDQFFVFVRMMKEHGVEPDVHQYYQMLKMASTVGNSMAAQFCFNKVKESSEFPDRRHELFDLLIRAYGRDNENNKVLPSYIQGNYSENAMKVISLFEEMKALDYRPNPSAISTIIRSYLLNNDIEGAKNIISEYGEGKEEMKRMVQNSFIRAYVANKDFAAAEELFSKMKEDRSLTSLQYNEMLRMCELTGDVEKAERLYEEMKSAGFTPNVFTYLHRIRTYLANRQPEPCIDIIEENIGKENNLRVDIFMVVLRHLVPTGNIENVKKMIELIKEHHNSKVPPKRLDHALSLVHIKAGNIEEASSLLPTPGEGDEGSVEVELNPYRKVAKTASTEGDVKYIENMIQFLKVNGLYYQTLDTFYLLALNKIGDVDGIRRLYKERIAEGFEPTEKFMALLSSIVEMRSIPDFEL